MSNSTATATTAATASGTVRSTDGHPIIIISARGSPDDEHAHSLQDSPPTSPTMLQHQGNERMLRFDADCVLIPPSTLHKKQHSRSQSLGRRPVLVTKSYSLPVLWKRKTSNEYEGTNGAAPEETPAVFKVSIPSFKTKKSPTIPSLSSPLHSPTTPTFQPQSILVNRQPTSPVSPLFSPSSPSQPRPQMKRFSSYGSTPSSSSSSTATPAHRELVPAISVTSATHTHAEETVPLRACCLACIHATEEPIRAGDTWEVKFTRGALRRRLSAQADDEAEANGSGGGGGVTMRRAGDFSAVLAASPLSPSSLSSPSALMGPGTGGVAVGVLSTTSAGGVISVDEVDKRRRSSESSQQYFDGQHHLVGAVEEEEDEENEDEDELFPLPSPRSTPRPSPTPSPNGSSSSLTVNKDGATKNNNSSSSTSSSSGSHGALKVAVPIPIVSSVPHPDRIYCASPARKMTCAWSSRSSSPGSQQQQGQPGCSSSSSSVNLRKAATSSFAAAATTTTTTTTTCDAAGGLAANLSGCRDKALAMMNANGSQDTLPIVGESSVEESQDDDDDDDEDEDEGEEGEVVGRGGTVESPRALYIPHLLRRGGKKKQSHVVHRADEVAYHEDVDEDGFIVLHAPADSTRHTPTSASSSRITDEELCAFLKEEAAAAAAQFSTASPSLGRQSGGAAAGDEPTSSPPVGTSYSSTAPMSIPIAAKPTTSPSLGFTLPSFLSSTSPSSPKDDRRSGGGGGGGLSISPTRQRARGILSRSLSRSRPSGQQSQQQQQLQPTDEVPTNTYANANASNGNSHNSGAAITENGAAGAPGTSPQTQTTTTTMPRRGRSQSFLKTGADMLRGVGQGLSLGSGSGMGGM